MGGAERNQRKRRQSERTAPKQPGAKSPGAKPSGAKAVASARAASVDRKRMVLIALVVLLVAGAVIGGVIWTNKQKNATAEASITPTTVALDVPVRRDGAVVEVGEETAKVTLDVYEDFLCPACRSLEEQHAGAIERELAAGTLKVRYHAVNMLNDLSDPEGYSTDAANAALLAADAGKFPSFHKSLFHNQPDEGARGWSKDQLVDLGRALGITTPDFTDGVHGGKYDGLITEEYQRARTTEHLLRDRGDGQRVFGTPTLASDGKVVDTTDPAWLTKLVGSPQG